MSAKFPRGGEQTHSQPSVYTTSGLYSNDNTRKYHQIDVYIYQCGPYSGKTDKLSEGRRRISIKKSESYYFKIKIISFIIYLDETMPLVMVKSISKIGTKVSKELALFNQSSVGYS